MHFSLSVEREKDSHINVFNPTLKSVGSWSTLVHNNFLWSNQLNR